MSYTTNFQLMEQARKQGLPLVGVFNKDALPSVRQQGFYIINLSDTENSQGESLPGTHWTVMYIEGKKACYWDSFGFPPPLEAQHFLKPYIPYPYNRHQIQNEKGGYCGVYVLYFMKFMTLNRQKKPSLDTRMKIFSSLFYCEVERNLTRLKELTRGIFPFQ